MLLLLARHRAENGGTLGAFVAGGALQLEQQEKRGFGFAGLGHDLLGRRDVRRVMEMRTPKY